MKTYNVGILGAGFIGNVHADAFLQVPGTKIAAVCDLDESRGKSFVQKYKTPVYYKNFQDMLKADIDIVTIGVPNYLHYQYVLEAAKAGKHIICEKPLALSLEQADEMIEACQKAGVILGYAEELCFIPKFMRMKQICDEGGIGKVYMVKQCEKHGGPYSPWFWQEDKAGGGIMMDMGCHSIEFCRWFLGKPQVKSVYAHMATYLHKEITKQEDHVIVILEFEGGAIAVCESSWALKGGMDSIAEAYGTEGVIYADLLRGMGLKCYSEHGFMPNPFESKGWSFPDYEWNWNNGYPQEMAHFVDCIRTGSEPRESGKDGRVVLEIMLAGYHSAATGKKVNLPFEPKGVKYPVDLWLNPRKDF